MNNGKIGTKTVYVFAIGLLGMMSALLIVLWLTPTQDVQQAKQVHKVDAKK